MAHRIPRQADREVLQGLLRNMRNEAGLKQVTLAQKLGKPQPFVSRYETGERQLDILELRAVCRICGMSVMRFLRKLERALKDT